MESLKISIITINYNNAIGLEKTIQSVVSQEYEHIEYIIIDGGSSDLSRQVIEKYEDKISYWVSEPDSGIYNAMNKGIVRSSGEYLLFLNSADVLINEHSIAQAVNLSLTHDLVSANLIMEKDVGTEEWIPDDGISFQTFFSSTIPHPSTFIRRSLFEKIGMYNENYKIVSDWEFFLLAICRHNCSYKHIDLFLTTFSDGGISSMTENFKAIALEREQILQKHFPYFIEDYKRYKYVREQVRKVRVYLKLKKFAKRLFKNKKDVK